MLAYAPTYLILLQAIKSPRMKLSEDDVERKLQPRPFSSPPSFFLSIQRAY